MSTRLEIEPAYRAALSAAGLTSFESFMSAQAAPAVSKHRHRETVPIEIEVDGEKKRFFLKRVFRVPTAHSILPWLRLRPGYSQPAREWAACRMMREAGLPAMERVAFGEKNSLGLPTQAFILVAASPYKHTLEEWLTPGFERPRALSEDERLDLIRAVARLGQDISDAGFDWPDADAKHIYAELSPEGASRQWRFTLIDLERVSRARRAKWPNSMIEWLIFRSMNPLQLTDEEITAVGQTTSTDFAVQHACYATTLSYGRGTLVADGLELVDGYIHPRRRHLQKVGDIHVDLRYRNALERIGIVSLDSVFELESGRSLTKPGLSAHRDRIQLELEYGDGQRRAAYLKRFRTPPMKEQLRRLWNGGMKRSSARLEARYARRLEEAGIGTLTTIAWGQSMRGGVEQRSFLITDRVPGESLEKLADRAASGNHSVAATDKFDIIRQIAAVAGRMHGEGLFHRDFYLCHIFLTRNAAGKQELRVIDLGRMISRLPLRATRWMIKDLAALDYSAPRSVVTRADRVRFLYHYIAVQNPSAKGWRHLGPDDLKQWRRMIHSYYVSDIVRRTRKMAAHDAKRALRHQRSQNPA